MPEPDVEKLTEHLKAVHLQEGRQASILTVRDWLDVLDELQEAGIDTMELQRAIRRAAYKLNIRVRLGGTSPSGSAKRSARPRDTTPAHSD